MFGSIVVGTDGSNTAQEAVRQASELARALGAKVYLVSAYEPVPEGRLRDERQVLPADSPMDGQPARGRGGDPRPGPQEL